MLTPVGFWTTKSRKGERADHWNPVHHFHLSLVLFLIPRHFFLLPFSPHWILIVQVENMQGNKPTGMIKVKHWLGNKEWDWFRPPVVPHGFSPVGIHWAWASSSHPAEGGPHPDWRVYAHVRECLQWGGPWWGYEKGSKFDFQRVCINPRVSPPKNSRTELETNASFCQKFLPRNMSNTCAFHSNLEVSHS